MSESGTDDARSVLAECLQGPGSSHRDDKRGSRHPLSRGSSHATSPAFSQTHTFNPHKRDLRDPPVSQPPLPLHPPASAIFRTPRVTLELKSHRITTPAFAKELTRSGSGKKMEPVTVTLVTQALDCSPITYLEDAPLPSPAKLGIATPPTAHLWRPHAQTEVDPFTPVEQLSTSTCPCMGAPGTVPKPGSVPDAFQRTASDTYLGLKLPSIPDIPDCQNSFGAALGHTPGDTVSDQADESLLDAIPRPRRCSTLPAGRTGDCREAARNVNLMGPWEDTIPDMRLWDIHWSELADHHQEATACHDKKPGCDSGLPLEMIRDSDSHISVAPGSRQVCAASDPFAGVLGDDTNPLDSDGFKVCSTDCGTETETWGLDLDDVFGHVMLGGKQVDMSHVEQCHDDGNPSRCATTGHVSSFDPFGYARVCSTIPSDAGSAEDEWNDTLRYERNLREAAKKVPSVKPERTFHYQKLLVVGASCTGKSTLIANMLAPYGAAAGRVTPCTVGEFTADPSPWCSAVEVVDTDRQVVYSYSIQETPSPHDQGAVAAIVDHITQQQKLYYAMETDPNRNIPLGCMSDMRVDAVLYLVPPHRAAPQDLEAMRKLAEHVTVVPLMAKADSMTDDELAQYRRVLHDQPQYKEAMKMSFHNIFTEYDLTGFKDDQTPFVVMGSRTADDTMGQMFTPVRAYRWGRCHTLKYSDTAAVRKLLFEDRTAKVKAETERRYLQYRKCVLSWGGQTMATAAGKATQWMQKLRFVIFHVGASHWSSVCTLLLLCVLCMLGWRKLLQQRSRGSHQASWCNSDHTDGYTCPIVPGDCSHTAQLYSSMQKYIASLEDDVRRYKAAYHALQNRLQQEAEERKRQHNRRHDTDSWYNELVSQQGGRQANKSDCATGRDGVGCGRDVTSHESYAARIVDLHRMLEEGMANLKVALRARASSCHADPPAEHKDE